MDSVWYRIPGFLPLKLQGLWLLPRKDWLFLNTPALAGGTGSSDGYGLANRFSAIVAIDESPKDDSKGRLRVYDVDFSPKPILFDRRPLCKKHGSLS